MSKKSYEIAFRLGAKMDSSLRTAFANANRSMTQLNRNSGTLTKSSGMLSRSMQSVGTAGINMTKRISSGITTGLIAPFRGAINMVKQYSGALGLLSGGALAATGMGRLSAIENAQTSLTVMMGDAKTAKAFLDDVLDFAKTTPFAFPDLAETSRNLIAFGMDKAKVVPTMKAIGDAAAATGKGSEGLQQVAGAFGDMQISSQLSLGPIRSLEAAGVPALKILANQAGVSADAMAKSISAGSVDSKKAIDQLVQGMQDGTDGLAGSTAAMAGIMEETKKNWTGSVDSLKSSISSTMATIMDPAKPHIQAAMAWFGNTFSKLPPVIFSVVDAVKPAFKGISTVVKNASTYIDGIFNTLRGGDGLTEGVLSFEKLGFSTDEITSIVGGIKVMQQNFKDAFSKIAEYVPVLVGAVKTGFTKIGPFLATSAKGFMAFSNGVRNVISFIAPYISQALGAVFNVIRNVINKIRAFWSENGAEIIQALKNVAKVIGSIFKVLGPIVLFVIKMVWNNIKGVIQGGLNIILGLVKVFSSLFTGNWKGLWDGVKQLLGGALQFLWNLWNLMMMGRLVKGVATVVKSIAGFFKGLGPKLATNVQYYYHLFMDKFYQIGIGILRTITNSVGRIVGVARNAVTNFVNVFQMARTFGVNIFMSIVSAIRNLFSNVVGFIKNAFSSVVGAVMGRVSSLVGSIQGFLSTLWLNIQTIFLQIHTAMTTPFTSLSGIVQTVVSSVSGLVRGLFEGVTAAGRGAINGLVVAANAMIGGINNLSFSVPDWVPGIGGKSVGFSIPKIPMLAQGGVTTGPTLAMIGEGLEQEAVLPLSKLEALLNVNKEGGTGGNQYVYRPTFVIQGDANKKDLVNVNKQGFQEYKRWAKKMKDDEDRLEFR